MAQEAPAPVFWEVEDGKHHNFSPASIKNTTGLYLAAAPLSDVPGWGLEDADLGLRMMSLTSWLDLICKCKIMHVLCIMTAEELEKKYVGIGDGDLQKTVEGQGLSFHHVALPEAKTVTPEVLAKSLEHLKSLPSFNEESAVIACSDGRVASPVVAAAWLVLSCGEAPATALRSIEECAEQASACRTPLEAFAGEDSKEEAFVALLEEVQKTLSFE